MTGLVIVSSMADQMVQADYTNNVQIGTRHLELESLTVFNKSATNYYLQLFNLPFTVDARNFTNTVAATGAITLAGHKFLTGDKVISSDASSCYVRIAPPSVNPDIFYLYDTLAHALAGGTAGLQAPSGDGVTGTVRILNASDAPLFFEEMPLMGTGSAPSNIISYLNGRFTRGLFARIMNTINDTTIGSPSDAGNDAKFVARFRYPHGA